MLEDKKVTLDCNAAIQLYTPSLPVSVKTVCSFFIKSIIHQSVFCILLGLSGHPKCRRVTVSAQHAICVWKCKIFVLGGVFVHYSVVLFINANEVHMFMFLGAFVCVV